MNEIINLAKSEYEKIIDEIQSDFFDIPFGNSKFQTEMFVIASQITPERMYRQLGLSIMEKLRTLKDFEYELKKEIIQQKKHEDTLNNINADKYEKELAQLELDRFESFNFDRQKHINDVLKELNILYSHYKKLPKYTNDQFEEGEKTYFEQRLNRQILGLTGAKESLINMIDDNQTLNNVQEKIKNLNSNELHQLLNEIRENSLVGRVELKEVKK